ncbi:dTDP-4-dehydrorhamnose reductase [Alicyclobacillus sp. ALC3]|uniref:dTDP-4-dehydrorhamnose reductase n=1 Tax=Alicyclobacillus sp. ALC3 TaxID=2796143 RepID=UPI002379E31E|nr:dTDP-4-dehydrorhamnose reductase [Alicyclobacillus sp. ALC3]WDL95158.1 dTDP-4-dehydrorhamnose reductase [Alicyclobacillus sp. ALC3]
MKTVLVTGADGQLGQELLQGPQEHLRMVGYNRHQLDVCNVDCVQSVFEDLRPDAVVHAAAYTSVDRAETDALQALRVNALGTRNVVEAARRVGAKVCYISTDYVFDGTSDGAYRETDRPSPINVYGQSKWFGEVLAQSGTPAHFVVRTSWLYGQYGANFVTKILALAEHQGVLQVVNDQTGSPTYARDLAGFIVQLLDTDHYGIYHASNAGTCSWYEFAKEIFRCARRDVRVIPCTSAEFPQSARRPLSSALHSTTMQTAGFTPLRDWRDALAAYFRDKQHTT